MNKLKVNLEKLNEIHRYMIYEKTIKAESAIEEVSEDDNFTLRTFETKLFPSLLLGGAYTIHESIKSNSFPGIVGGGIISLAGIGVMIRVARGLKKEMMIKNMINKLYRNRRVLDTIMNRMEYELTDDDDYFPDDTLSFVGQMLLFNDNNIEGKLLTFLKNVSIADLTKEEAYEVISAVLDFNSDDKCAKKGLSLVRNSVLLRDKNNSFSDNIHVKSLLRYPTRKTA